VKLKRFLSSEESAAVAYKPEESAVSYAVPKKSVPEAYWSRRATGKIIVAGDFMFFCF
jgi:hypothetical protein